MDPQAARLTLLAQHEQIRTHLGSCSALARGLRGGEPLDRELDHAVVELRAAIDAHNRDEVELIRRLLAGTSPRGEALVNRMLVEHDGEHAAITQLLVGSLDEVAAQMDELVETVEAHMAAEERTFLSPQVLRHDTVRDLAPSHGDGSGLNGRLTLPKV